MRTHLTKKVCVCVGGGGRPPRALHPWDGLRLINAVEVLFIVSSSKLMLTNVILLRPKVNQCFLDKSYA